MAQKQMSRGAKQSMETLGNHEAVNNVCDKDLIFSAIETELREVQQRAIELQKKAKTVTDQVDCGFKGKYSSPSNVSVERDDLKNSIKINEAALRASTSKVNLKSRTIDVPLSQPSNTTQLQSKQQSNKRNFSKNSPNSDDSETEKKYLELIDLLTVKMFQSDQSVPEKQEQRVPRPKKSNSLPRNLETDPGNSIHPLQKSSSQHFQFENHSSASAPGLSAYERLFGRPRPGKNIKYYHVCFTGGYSDLLTLWLNFLTFY